MSFKASLERGLQKAVFYLALVFFACFGTLIVTGTAYVVYLAVTNMREW